MTMAAEHDNLRAVLDWSEAGDPLLCLRIATAWAPFWLIRGHFAEGGQKLSQAITGAPGTTLERARALHQAGRLAAFQGDYPSGTELLCGRPGHC
jgi:hypothetical protein